MIANGLQLDMPSRQSIAKSELHSLKLGHQTAALPRMIPKARFDERSLFAFMFFSQALICGDTIKPAKVIRQHAVL